ncbi:hypothetical protein MMC07_008420 [Pseudocyphellaria aurata]|nr:hypothetical protein [Pseudocyphellaria aurata]
MKASHILPYSLGQDLMKYVFGGEEYKTNELFSAKNGLLIHSSAVIRFGKGCFVIVPSAHEESAVGIEAWHKSMAKRYIIRVTDRNATKMTRFLQLSMRDKPRVDLDDQKLQFLSSHRPRARCLYHLYGAQMLRCSHLYDEHEEILSDYLIGSQDFLDGTENPQEMVEVDLTVLAAANDAVKTSLKNRREMSTKKLE